MEPQKQAQPVGDILSKVIIDSSPSRFAAIQKSLQEEVERACSECHKPFKIILDRNTQHQYRCDPCDAAHTEMIRQARIRSKVPKAFQNTERERLPEPRKLDEILAWQYGPEGMLLYGPTGAGKSRCVWELIKRDIARVTFEVLDSSSAIHYASKFGKESAQVENWLDDLCKKELVFLDDIFKNKMTDSFEGFIFSIVDQRVQNELPIIVTCNDTGESLTSRLTVDRGAPLIRRLRECCRVINFNTTTPITHND